MSTSEPLQHRDGGELRIAAAVVAAIVMLVVGYLYLASGLVVPSLALLPLWAGWLALAWYGVRLARARSYLVLAVPVITAAILFLALTVGGRVFGWQP